MGRESDRYLVVAVHDVCPRHERAVQRWRMLLDRWGVTKRSYAVVPFDGEAQRLAGSPSLVESLRGDVLAGSEIVLHGYTHRHVGPYRSWADRLRDRLTTRGCAEFSTLPPQEAALRIKTGLEYLDGLFPGRIHGFTPPGWWLRRDLQPLLRELGFSFCTATFGVVDLQRGSTLKAPAVLGLPGRGLSAFLMHGYAFRLLPLWLKRRKLLRVALHPYDLECPRFLRESERLLRQGCEQRRLCVYEELVS